MKPAANKRPRAQPKPVSLEQLADQIHRCFLKLEYAGTADWIQAEAARVFDLYYRWYRELGGRPFRRTENRLQDLITLEARCRSTSLSGTEPNLSSPGTGKWSKPMKKAAIREALGLDSYYALSRLAKQGVYQLRQDPTNRQRWRIRLDILDPETRQRFSAPS